MPEKDEFSEFLMGGGGKSFAFDEMGNTVTGTIVAQAKRQQTDLETGEPQFWNNGEPKYMLVITLATKLSDTDDDDGTRNVYLRGGNYTAVKGKGAASLVAVRDAVKRAGAQTTEIGGTLTLSYSGEGKAANRAFNAPKLYSAEYAPPDFAVDIDDMA
jgi:hypothetical protein